MAINDNNRDKTFTRAKRGRRMAPIKESVARCLQQLDTADRHAPVRGASTQAAKMLATPDQQISLTEPIAARGR